MSDTDAQIAEAIESRLANFTPRILAVVEDARNPERGAGFALIAPQCVNFTFCPGSALMLDWCLN